MNIITKHDFNEFINLLIEDENYDVHGVKSKGSTFVFGPLDSSDELRLDYDTTILPPKKYFLPQYETLMEFDMDNPLSVKKKDEIKQKILVGVHSYDFIAIRQMDAYYLTTDVSKEYLSRRKNTIIIVSDVLTVNKRAFFGSMNTADLDNGYDLYITDLGDKVAIETGSKKGEELLKKASKVRSAGNVEIQKVEAVRSAAKEQAKRGMKVQPSQWYSLLDQNYGSSVWKSQSEKCLACGTCTMVCPTCYCYDIVDDVDLKDQGKRIRTWDGCLLRQFTEVAGGEVFRENIKDRYRHRFFRKGKYLPDRLGFVACVGCGRCCLQCVPDIADPVDVMNMVFDHSDSFVEDESRKPQTISLDSIEIKEEDAKPLHHPKPATITRVEDLTAREKLFEIELDSGKALNHDPGQFVEVSLMGVGEAPISIASPPKRKRFDLVIRKVGEVTNKIHDLKKGDKMGIRGPFGTGFDVEELKGRDLLFIAAGLGLPPLRSLIAHVLDEKHRKDFGKVTILCGCREPCEVLFDNEIEDWQEIPDVTVMRTVDRCPDNECWEGDIGLITKLIPRVKFDPKDTFCMIIGPPVVYPFCIQILKDLGVPDNRILVSLERRMKCGVGKCGHCQINDLYCCKDGPVFNYHDIKDLPEAFE